MSQSNDQPTEYAHAAELQADVVAERIADVYAEALLDAAERGEKAAALLDEFDALLTDVLDRFPKFEAILISALIPRGEKAGILDRTLKPRLSPMLLNFLKVVSRHGRLDLLREIHRQARLLLDKRQGRVHIRLTTAMPVDDRLAARLVAQLRTAVGGEPILRRQVDPQLIGGAVLRIGDTVYDGSIASQLKRLQAQMIDRSVHEIQSRRDRFRNPAGN